jgi:hypothetical protein
LDPTQHRRPRGHACRRTPRRRPQPLCSPSSASLWSSSNANSPRPTLDTNVTLPPTRPALYRAPSGFRRARPLQTLCGI